MIMILTDRDLESPLRFARRSVRTALELSNFHFISHASFLQADRIVFVNLNMFAYPELGHQVLKDLNHNMRVSPSEIRVAAERQIDGGPIIVEESINAELYSPAIESRLNGISPNVAPSRVNRNKKTRPETSGRKIVIGP
jgi:hypothetical protein